MYRAESHGKMARVGSSWMKDARALLGEVQYAEVMQQMCAEPLRDLVLAALATAASYLVLTGCELSATTTGPRALKLREYVYVPLQSFTIKGSERSHLRQALNRAERDELTSAIASSEQVPALLPDLQVVSNVWLEGSRVT